jgi:hypothetical protein
MDNNLKKQRTDDNSLFYLLTILLRYRKLIIGTTLISFVLALAGYFIYPANQNITQYLASLTFSIRQQARQKIPMDLRSFVNSPDIILDSLRAAGVESFHGISLTEEAQTLKALSVISEHLVRNAHLSGAMLQIANVSNTSNANNQEAIASTVNITFRYNDFNTAEAFVASLFALSNERIEKVVRADMEAMVRHYDQLLSISNPSQSIQEVIVGSYAQYVSFKNILDGNVTVLMQIGEPLIMKEDISEGSQQRYAFTGIIIVFTGFFVSLFLAFALNIVYNIKNDEDAMRKIRAALEKPGGK